MASTSWLKLSNQTALITGAGSGIGKAIALAFAGQGCNVLLADVNPNNLENVASACKNVAPSDRNILVKSSVCNVADKSDVEMAVAASDELAADAAEAAASASSASPSVPPMPSVSSILINCAGITRDGTISNMLDKEWDDVMDVNLKGTFWMCRAFCQTERVASLLSSNSSNSTSSAGGSIVNIGSIVSQYGNIGQTNYAASKGGVVGLTRALAKEMAFVSHKFNNNEDESSGNGGSGLVELVEGETTWKPWKPMVRVNCIVPGFIHTPMSHAVPPKLLLQMQNQIAMKRLGRPEDIANLALFLSSSERSGYITGEAMECSGMLRL